MPRTLTAVQPEPTIGYLIALWLAIHGGDPAPDQMASALLIRAAASQLANRTIGRQIHELAGKALAEAAGDPMPARGASNGARKAAIGRR